MLDASHRLRSLLNAFVPKSFARAHELAERGLLLKARMLEESRAAKERLYSLDEAEFRVFSQWGEDGILSWLFSCLKSVEDIFVEFGVEDYRECNSRYLLQSKNWRGLALEASESHAKKIIQQPFYWRHDLKVARACVDRENINALLKRYEVAGDIGLLSIDIDGNDYWVWESCCVVHPAVVVCEYNAAFGDRKLLVIPYSPEFKRRHAHFSGLFFGASIRALIHLASRKGYTFIGTNSAGCNAFFVRSDLASEVVSRLETIRAFPSRFREARTIGGVLSYLDSRERSRLIAKMPVLDIEANVTRDLEWYGNELCSEPWARGSPVVVSETGEPG